MKTKLIFNSYVARQLLVNYKHPVVDILKDYKRNNGVIFVFEETEKFLENLSYITNNK
jgi:hypothetical protein